MLAFGLGLVFGFTFDTAGPLQPPEFRRRVPGDVEDRSVEPAPELERPVAGDTTVVQGPEGQRGP